MLVYASMTPLRRAGELSSGTLDGCMPGVYASMMCSIEIELHGPQGALLKRSCEADTDGDCLLREVIGDSIDVFILEEGAPQSILSIQFIYQSLFPPIYL